MAALATRAFVAAGQDFYLCPLSENQISRAERQGAVAAGLGRDSRVAAGVAARRGRAAGRAGGRGILRGRGVDRHGWRPGGAVDGASLAGAFAGVRAGPGGGPGTPSGEATAELHDLVSASRARSVGSRGPDGGGRHDRDATRSGRLAELHGAHAESTRPVRALSRPSGTAGDRGVLRDRRASGRDADPGDEAGDGLAGLRDECPGDDLATGGVGLPGPVSDRGRLVTVEGTASGIDPDVPAGRSSGCKVWCIC